MYTLLVIDDEPSIVHAFRRAFKEPDYQVQAADACAEGLAQFSRARPDVVILDVHLPDGSGLDLFAQLRQADARVPVILITGHGTTDLAIEAMKRGAFDFLLKPLELPALRDLVGRACASSRLMQVPAVLPDDGEPDDGRGDALIGRCAAMQDVYKGIGRVAPTETTVLILGESGTGKELVARALYQHSKRAQGPFLAINCGAIPETLLESELFGHEKGAFTGADRKRIGKFEQCHGGTIFLDEVGDMTPLTQVKLLRVLQDRTFERVGGNETVTADVRVVAATNADLEKLVAAGRFRTDLYFRLNGFTLRLPPLRERGDDLPRLAGYFLRRFARELGRPLPPLPPETLALLCRYPWPGNVRELQSVLRQALLQMSGPVLLPEYLPHHLQGASPTAPTPTPAPMPSPTEETDPIGWDRFIEARLAAGSEDLYAECLQHMERQLLTRLLQRTGGNQLQAAKLLGITRGSLRTKIRALQIHIDRAVWVDDDQGD